MNRSISHRIVRISPIREIILIVRRDKEGREQHRTDGDRNQRYVAVRITLNLSSRISDTILRSVRGLSDFVTSISFTKKKMSK